MYSFGFLQNMGNVALKIKLPSDVNSQSLSIISDEDPDLRADIEINAIPMRMTAC